MKTFLLIIFSFATLLIQAQRVLINSVSFNSNGNEYGLRILNDRLYFISDVPDSSVLRSKDRFNGYYFTDVIEFQEGDRKEAKLVKNSSGEEVSINSQWYDGPVTISIKDSVIFFSNTSEGYEHGKMGIYWSKELQNGAYSDPQPFPLNNEGYSCMHPFYDEDHSMLYFVSDLSGDSTGFNLYRIPFSQGTFGKLDTLVQLNSPFNEIFPIVQNDALYFSSDRPGGKGGMDLYQQDSFSEVIALIEPFNSEFDDFAIYFTSNNQGYFSSNRIINGKSDDNIFEFYVPKINKPSTEKSSEIDPIIANLEDLLKTFEPGSSEAIILLAALDKLKEQEIQITKLQNKIAENQFAIMNYVDSTSSLTFEERVKFYQEVMEPVEANYAEVLVKTPIQVKEFITEQQGLQTQITQTEIIEKQFYKDKLIPFVSQDPKKLGDINTLVNHYRLSDTTVSQLISAAYPMTFYFDFDKFKLSDEQMSELRQFIAAVKGYNGKIILEGHTDNSGPSKYNLNLSRKRTQFIYKILVSEGFQAENIVLVPKGEIEPVESNATLEGRRKNRRVVVKL